MYLHLTKLTYNEHVVIKRWWSAVVVSGGSGAVRLSLHSLLQWRAVTACSFCLGILQRFCLFFYPGPPSLLFVLFTSFVFLSTD